MLTKEEEKFVAYWQDQRQRKKEFLKKISIGLPLVSLAVLFFFINFLSGWYGKADTELRRHSSVIIVILIAVIATVVFITLFAVRFKWDRNEADYQHLLKKRDAVPTGSAKSSS